MQIDIKIKNKEILYLNTYNHTCICDAISNGKDRSSIL
jgi:hypothetical protein